MRIGIDTYSYHRLLGEPRPGEQAVVPWEDPLPEMFKQAKALRCDVACLQTCFLGEPRALDPAALLAAAGPLEPLFAWGHPEGLAFGTAPAPVIDDLLDWIDLTAELRVRLLRIVVGGPRLREAGPFADRLARTLPQLRHVAAHATDRGVGLAIENHGDMTSSQLAELITEADVEGLGVCFDTANAQRMGEAADVAAGSLAPLVRIVHLKDIESPERAADPVAGPCSVPFGSGVVPLEGVLASLADPIRTGAPVCIEIGQIKQGDDECELVADGVSWLRAIEAERTR